MAIWNIIEVFKDENLLRRVQAELISIDFQGVSSNSDVEKLLSLPLLQSIYSELMRLRVEVQTIFNSEKEDIIVNEWRFPKKSLVIVPAGAAHRDINFWNTQNGRYSLDEFWAERFLVYPNDPDSGPHRNTMNNLQSGKCREGASKSNGTLDKPKHVSSGLADSFLPYGVGERTCPGRGFARREIMVFCALIVTRFDIEILSSEKTFATSSTFYGLGTQRPLKQIPFRIRKRRINGVES